MVDVGTRPHNGQASTPEQDWPAQAADAIERVVHTVRDKTTGPALTASRGLVYGTFAAIVGLAALVLTVIAVVRLTNKYLPDDVFGQRHMWAVYGLYGTVFTVAGLVLWSRRHGPTEETRAD